MTENYYLVQELLPLYFSNATNRKFFYDVVASSRDNIKVFFEKECYGWTKRDLHRINTQDKKADVAEEEKIWKYMPIDSAYISSEDKKWDIAFVQFPPDFVNNISDSFAVAIAMKPNQNDIEIRLFMMEAEKDDNNAPQIYLCENLINEKTHKYLDKIPYTENFLSTFTENVMNILEQNA